MILYVKIIKKHILYGTKITFTYIGTTEKGVPRHPNYLRIEKVKNKLSIIQ